MPWKSATIVMGTIISLPRLVGDFFDEKWVAAIRDVGFPITVAVACGWALRWIGLQLLKNHNQFVTTIAEESKRHTRGLRKVYKKLEESTSTQKEISETQKDIREELHEQTKILKEQK